MTLNIVKDNIFLHFLVIYLSLFCNFAKIYRRLFRPLFLPIMSSMKTLIINTALSLMTLSALVSCSPRRQSNNAEDQEKISLMGAFSGDSAYAFIERQLQFGPRTPGSEGNRLCGDYIIEKMREYGADSIVEQTGMAEFYTGETHPYRNILARFNTGARRKILLLAHYDTRPWADQEDSAINRKQPVPGANDGGSGVAVLIEIARNFKMQKPDVGVDLLFVDAEDSGDSSSFDGSMDTWCIGTQEFMNSRFYSSNGEQNPSYGILVDMVGGKDARFHREYYSNKNARAVNDRIWAEAAALGLGDIFVNSVGGMSVVDDHVFVNKGGIPCANIIENVNAQTGSFPPTWHTLEDNLDNISSTSLSAVGNVVLNIVYKEKAI